jgi:hypothetical protein
MRSFAVARTALSAVHCAAIAATRRVSAGAHLDALKMHSQRQSFLRTMWDLLRMREAMETDRLPSTPEDGTLGIGAPAEAIIRMQPVAVGFPMQAVGSQSGKQ